MALSALLAGFIVLAMHTDPVISSAGANSDIIIEKSGSGNYEVLEGSSYTLTCSSNIRNQEKAEFTHMRIVWQHNDRDIEPTARRHAVSTGDGYISHLQFKYVDRYLDQGKYKCEFQNITIGAVDGSAVYSEHNLNVIWVNIPQVVVVNATQTSMTLLCKFEDWSFGQMVSIQWLHNLLPAAGPIGDSASPIFVIADTSAVEKSGTYHCLVTASVHLEGSSLRGATPQNKNSILSSNWYTLVVNDSTGVIPLFDQSRYKFMTIVPPRQRIVLECPFVGMDASSSNAKWLEMVPSVTQPLSCDSFTTKIIEANSVSYNESGAYLRFKESKTNGCGGPMNYHCSYLATTSTGETIEQRFAYSVRTTESQEPAILHLVAIPASTYNYKTDSDKKRLCLTAILKPTIVDTFQWFVPSSDGRAVAVGPTTPSTSNLNSAYEFLTLPSGNLQLCVKPKNVTFGKYSITVRNAYGNASAQIDIAKWKTPTFLSYTIGQQEPVKPNGSLNVTVKEGESLTVRCNLDALPYPATTIFWRWTPSKDRMYVQRYNTSTVSILERSGILQLTNISIAQAGNYTCSPIVLFSSGRFDMIDINVTVIRTLKIISASAIIENNELTVKCVVEGENWDNDSSVNVTTYSGDGFQMQARNIDMHTRVVSRVFSRGLFPSKSYKCIAKSGGERLVKEFSVNISAKTLTTPENTTAIEGEQAMMHCQPDEQSFCLVIWRQVKSGSYVVDCQKDAPSNAEPCVMKNGTLYFKNVRRSDAGWWNCAITTRVKTLKFEPEFEQQAYLSVGEHISEVNSITRTITIVIVSAVAYLVLVLGITLWCSMRLMRKRKRNTRCDERDTQMTTLLGAQNTRSSVSSGRRRENGTSAQRLNGQQSQPSSIQQVSPAYTAPQSHTRSNMNTNSNDSPHSNGSFPAPDPPVSFSSNTVASLPTLGPLADSSPCMISPTNPVIYPKVSAAWSPAWREYHSSLTRGSCSTCDALPIGGVPTFCPVHSFGPMPSTMLEQPQSVLSHQTNITSVSQQQGRPRFPMVHQPVNNTPISRSRCSNESLRHIERNQVQFLGRIGTGRFGDVAYGHLFVAESQAPLRVTIKTLGRKDEEARRDFDKELQTFRGVQHAFVTELLGVCFDEVSFPFFLLEYPEWGSLKHFLLAVRADHERMLQSLTDGTPIDKQSPPLPPLSLEQKIMMCLHVTAGMDFLASHGRIHTDLACRNLLLTSDLSVKVGLLGVHTMFENEYYYVPYSASSSLNNTTCRSKPIGLRWMAPECVSYEIRLSHEYESAGSISIASVRSDTTYTTASDVWSFGMTVFEIFSYGELPFSQLKDQRVIETLMAADKGNLTQFATSHVIRFAGLDTRLLSACPHFELDPHFNDFSRSPQTLQLIVERCLQTNPHQRLGFGEISAILGGQLDDTKS